jgi:hypothetical protein
LLHFSFHSSATDLQVVLHVTVENNVTKLEDNDIVQNADSIEVL